MGDGIQLGSYVIDTRTAYRGTVTAITTYDGGSPQALVERDARPEDDGRDTARWFELARLQIGVRVDGR